MMNTETLQLVNDLERFPDIKERLSIMLSVAKNIDGKYELADDVEEKICEEITKMGCDLIKAWGTGQEQQKSIEASMKNPNLVRHSKKNCIGIQRLEQ